MKLLIVVPGGVDQSGEVAVIPVLLNLFKLLSQQHQICIIALEQHQQLTEYRLVGCQVISLPKMKTRALLSAYWLARQRLKHHDFTPDVVHSFWLGKPTLLAAMLSKTYKAPLFTSVGGGEVVSFDDIGYGGGQTRLGRLLNRSSVRLADCVSGGSHFVQSLIQQKLAVKPIHLPLGIDVSFWSFRACNPFTPSKSSELGLANQWRFVQIASINTVKDPWLMLDILAQLVRANFDCRLDWIGEDTLNGVVQQRAKQMGLSERIHFLGFKTQTELKAMLATYHFVIQTSRFESQGIALAEASSQGVCPVGTDVGWLQDIELGLKASQADLASQLAKQVLALAADPEARSARVEIAQRWIASHDVVATVAAFNTIYNKLVLS